LNSLRMVDQRPNPYDLLRKKMRDLQGLRADGLGLLMTVGKHNIGRLTESLLAFQQEGFRSVSFSFMQEVGPFASCATPKDLTAGVMAVVRAIAERKLEALGCMTLIQWIIRLTRGHSGFVCLGSPCGAGRSVATVLSDGDIGPCDSIYSDRFFHRDVDHYMKALDDDPYLQGLRERSVRKMQPCSECDVQAHCNGTCPGSAVLATGGIQSVDPHECAFHYGLIRELLWTLCDPQAGPQLMKYCERHIATRKEYGF
jgi:radical SAM protein with 4Fe4S-binding SPASM domain